VDRNDEFADRLTQSLPPERVSELRDEVLTDNTAALRIVEEAAARRYARHSLRRGLSIRELVECDFHQFGDRCVKVEALLPLDSEAQNGRQGEHDAPSHAGGNADAGDDDVPYLLRPVDIESGLARSSRLSASAAAYTPLSPSRATPTSSKASPPALRRVPPSRPPSRPCGSPTSALREGVEDVECRAL